MALLVMAGGAANRAIAAGMVVIVRRPDGSRVGISPHTGAQVDVPASVPRAKPDSGRSCPDTPQSVVIADGAARYRQHWLEGDAHLVLAEQGATARWWYWRPLIATRVLDLPLDLEPAFPSDTCGRWFHGAVADSAHLGSGALRLIAVDLATGEIGFNREFDRRLELAATAVSPDGASIAHLQGGNTRLELWLADLHGDGREVALELPIGPAPVAPSAIDLQVLPDGDSTVAVTGVSWSDEDYPEPLVVTV